VHDALAEATAHGEITSPIRARRRWLYIERLRVGPRTADAPLGEAPRERLAGDAVHRHDREVAVALDPKRRLPQMHPRVVERGDALPIAGERGPPAREDRVGLRQHAEQE